MNIKTLGVMTRPRDMIQSLIWVNLKLARSSQTSEANSPSHVTSAILIPWSTKYRAISTYPQLADACKQFQPSLSFWRFRFSLVFQIGLKMVYEITTIKYCGKSSIFR